MDERTKATISAAVVLAANILAYWGITLDVDVWVDGIFFVVMVVSTGYGIWKNHNFTEAAAKAQGVLDHLKAEKIAEQARGE